MYKRDNPNIKIIRYGLSLDNMVFPAHCYIQGVTLARTGKGTHSIDNDFLPVKQSGKQFTLCQHFPYINRNIMEREIVDCSENRSFNIFLWPILHCHCKLKLSLFSSLNLNPLFLPHLGEHKLDGAAGQAFGPLTVPEIKRPDVQEEVSVFLWSVDEQPEHLCFKGKMLVKRFVVVVGFPYLWLRPHRNGAWPFTLNRFKVCSLRLGKWE